MNVVGNKLKTNKAKFLYIIVGAFILSFGLVYARQYYPPLRGLCAPINESLDSIEVAIHEALNGNPFAVFSVLAAPLTVIVAIVKGFTGKVSAITQTASEEKQLLDNQMTQMDNTFRTQYGELEKSKTEVESTLTTTRRQLDTTNQNYQELSKKYAALAEENADMKSQLKVINASLG